MNKLWLVFCLILISTISAVATAAFPFEINLAGISISADRNRYTIGEGETVILTVTAQNFSDDPLNETVTVTVLQADGTTETDPLTFNLGPGDIASQDLTYDADDLGEGVRTFVATLISPPSGDDALGNVATDSVIILPEEATPTPEIPPAFIVLIALTVILIISRK